MTKGALDVFAVVPPGARLEPDRTVDQSHEPFAEYSRVRVHFAGKQVDIAHYAKPCDVSGYQKAEDFSVLAAKADDNAYWVKLEYRATFMGESKVFLVIETCSSVTQTVCNAELSRHDEAGASEVTAICESITPAKPEPWWAIRDRTPDE